MPPRRRRELPVRRRPAAQRDRSRDGARPRARPGRRGDRRATTTTRTTTQRTSRRRWPSSARRAWSTFSGRRSVSSARAGLNMNDMIRAASREVPRDDRARLERARAGAAPTGSSRTGSTSRPRAQKAWRPWSTSALVQLGVAPKPRCAQGAEASRHRIARAPCRPPRPRVSREPQGDRRDGALPLGSHRRDARSRPPAHHRRSLDGSTGPVGKVRAARQGRRPHRCGAYPCLLGPDPLASSPQAGVGLVELCARRPPASPSCERLLVARRHGRMPLRLARPSNMIRAEIHAISSRFRAPAPCPRPRHRGLHRVRARGGRAVYDRGAMDMVVGRLRGASAVLSGVCRARVRASNRVSGRIDPVGPGVRRGRQRLDSHDAVPLPRDLGATAQVSPLARINPGRAIGWAAGPGLAADGLAPIPALSPALVWRPGRQSPRPQARPARLRPRW